MNSARLRGNGERVPGLLNGEQRAPVRGVLPVNAIENEVKLRFVDVFSQFQSGDELEFVHFFAREVCVEQLRYDVAIKLNVCGY